MASKLPAVVGQLPPAEPEELLEERDRHAEVLYLVSVGKTQKDIAEQLGISRSTVQNWLKKAMQERRSRAENVDDELERIAGVYEAVMTDAYDAFRVARGGQGVAGPGYLRLVMEAADRVAKLRGIDTEPSPESGPGRTEVVVRIGGETISTTTHPTIEVGVRS